MIRAALAVLALSSGLVPLSAVALTLDMPAGARLATEAAGRGAVGLAIGPSQDGTVPLRNYSGQILRQAWQVPQAGATFDMLDALQDQLTAAGFAVVVSCDTRQCGGFDFRFALEVLPEPQMHVDLGDFRYLLAERGSGEGAEAVSLLVSRSGTEGFVQVIAVGPDLVVPRAGEGSTPPVDGLPPEAKEPPEAPSPAEAAATPPAAFDATTLAARLEAQGHVVLDDLDFASGSATLGEGPHASLKELAAYLLAHPDRRVVIVGHTDAVGSLNSNIALSRRRAASVVERLTGTYKVPAAQLAADGVGYLAPRASNLTETGREANRRVEAVLASTG